MQLKGNQHTNLFLTLSLHFGMKLTDHDFFLEKGIGVLPGLMIELKMSVE